MGKMALPRVPSGILGDTPRLLEDSFEWMVEAGTLGSLVGFRPGIIGQGIVTIHPNYVRQVLNDRQNFARISLHEGMIPDGFCCSMEDIFAGDVNVDKVARRRVEESLVELFTEADWNQLSGEEMVEKVDEAIGTVVFGGDVPEWVNKADRLRGLWDVHMRAVGNMPSSVVGFPAFGWNAAANVVQTALQSPASGAQEILYRLCGAAGRAALLSFLHLSQRRLAQEIVAAPEKDNGVYARRVGLEAVRLYPPVVMCWRKSVAHTTIGGFRVAAGTIVLCSPYLTQRNQQVFASPMTFDVGRWNGEKMIEGSYFPFGDLGIESRVGQFVIDLAGHLILAACRSWRFGDGTSSVQLGTDLLLMPGERFEVFMERISKSSPE